MIKRLLDSRLPLMVYNPPLVADTDYFESIHKAGGLSVLDTEFMPHESVRREIDELERRGILFGLRLRLTDAALIETIKARQFQYLDLVVFSYRQAGELRGLTFDHTRYKFFIETIDIDCVDALESLSPHGLVIRGSEAPGKGSRYSAFILMQWYLENTRFPLFIHGGVGWHTAAGMFAAGANGIVLDNQLYLTAQAPVDARFKNTILKIEENDSTVIGRTLPCQYRFFSKLGTRIVKDLKSREAGLKETQNPDDALYSEIAKNMTALDDSTAEPLQSLFYLGQDAVFAKHFVKASDDIGDVLKDFFETIGRRLGLIDDHDPMRAGTALAREHGTRYPIMQGPMANISDTPEFARRILDAGALPFFALASLPDDLTEKILSEGKKQVDRFGAGLIGIETFNKTIASHLAQVKKHQVPFALFAGGIPAQVLELEKAGTRAYLHTPSMMMLDNAIGSGCNRFIFEGSEAGGHVGTLSSLVLWEMALEKMLALPDKRRKALTAVFAGGLGTRYGSYFISGISAVLAADGVKVGIQVGSAYLFTKEIKETGALQAIYQDVVCTGDRTILTGETVGLTSRTAPTPFTEKMIDSEYEELGRKTPLSERKDRFEKENIGSLLIGAKGFCPDFKKIAGESGDICFIEYDEKEQYELGNFMVGDCLTFWSQPTTIVNVHERYFHQKKRLGDNLNALEIFSNRTSHVSDEIAIVGMGCIYPDAASPEQFWENILSKKYSIRTMPPERLDPDLYYDPDKKAVDKTYTRLAGTVEDFVFDHAKFGYTPEKAKKLSRSQQMILETAYQAAAGASILEDGLKLKASLREKTAVIVASCLGNEMGNDLHLKYYYPEIKWHLEKTGTYQALDAEKQQALLDGLRSGLRSDDNYEPVHGVVLNMEAARIAHHMGARGANYVVDAACATSFAAIDCAMKELLSGAHDTVIVGGLNTHLAPEPFVGFSKMGALSAGGSWPFDARADGFVLGEGAGIVILKRAKDALRDENKILGIIKGMGSSSDGKGKAIAAPNPKGQALALQRCFESVRSGVVPEDVDYIEAHGTSTVMGDQAEIKTLKSVYGTRSGAGVSSVKSQIGHLLGGAGMAGMIKVLLALKHKTLPPNGQFQNLAERHGLEDSNLYIIEEAAQWPAAKGRLRRAGVSSYGFGGINYHCVVEEFTGGYRPLARSIFADPGYDFNDDRIVVAGMGVVLPGAQDTDRFWQRLISGESAISQIPSQRFHNETYAAEEKASGYHLPVVRAGMVGGWEFDCKRFRIPPRTARHLDRAQLFSLDAAGQAIAQAGLTPHLGEGNKTAVILGTIPGELQVENVLRIRTGFVKKIISRMDCLDPALRDRIAGDLAARLRDRYLVNTEDTIPGLLSNIVTGRIANSFGCNGANFVVDASCASATIAIDLAAKGLKSGDYDYVLTGGVDANLYPTVLLAFKRLGLLADGECRFFDKQAGGYVMGEGAAVQVLTTYRKAVENRMPILGELNGISCTSSVTEHLLSPSDKAYAQAIDSCYDRLAVDKRQIRHLDVFAGANIFLDAVEKQAIEKSFPHSIGFGNIKPEFGYFKAANPAVVFSKLLLMAHYRKLLPNRSYNDNTTIAGDGPVLKARTSIRELEDNASVHLASNVNGIGGNHGHMVVGTLPARLMLAGAGSAGRPAMRPDNQVIDTIALKDKTEQPVLATGDGRRSLAVLLSGQGAQYPGMMRELYQSEPAIRKMLDTGNSLFREQRGYTLLDIMFADDERLNLTENTQPAVFLSSAAIYHVLSDRGFSPDYFIGHSVGEYTALFCAGMLGFEDTLQLIIKRADLMKTAAETSAGRIMVVFKDSLETGRLIEKSGIGELWLANKNSTNQTAVSGRSAAVDRFCKFLKSVKVMFKKLALSGAFHTPLFQSAADGMAAYLRDLTFNDVAFSRVISNTTAQLYPEDANQVKALLVRQIVSPVEFIEAVSGVHRKGVSQFVEIGPGKLLVNLLKRMSLGAHECLSAIDPKKGQKQSMEVLQTYLEKNDRLSPIQKQQPAAGGIVPTDKPAGRAPGENDYLADSEDFQAFQKANAPALEQMAYQAFLKQKHETALREIKKYNFCMEKVVIAGVSIGLPGMGNKVFNDNNFDRILNGNNFIEPLTMEEKEKIVDMNITRVFKEPDGNARLVKITRTEDVIQLAGKLGYFNLKNEYGIDFDYDVTISLAIAAGIEALKDAQIPLVMHYRETSSGSRLPEGFTLPKEMQDTTGVILTSLFPGFETLIDQMNNYYYNKFYVRPYKELENIYYHLMESVRDPEIKEQLTDWFFKIRERRKKYGTYKFDRNILFDLVPLGSAHFSQLIKARGPNIQMSGACASTTQAVGVAQDWIRTGRCDRVIIIGGEAATSEVQSPWIASGFLALGAASVKNVVSEAAKPFDAKRNGTILGSGAVSMVVEREDCTHARGFRGQAEILGTYIGNSAFHATKIDVNHLGSEMRRFVEGVENRHDLRPEEYAKSMVFMSHETFTPARGGSADAEITALKQAYPDHFGKITITNTKGYTGHTLGAAIEDAVLVKVLQNGMAPPIANLANVPPEFSALNFSRQNRGEFLYGLHYSAGFGSHFAFLFLKRIEESAAENNRVYNQWLVKVSGTPDPELKIINNTLCVESAHNGTEQPVEDEKEPPLENMPAGGAGDTGGREKPAPGVEHFAGTIQRIIAEHTGYTVDMLEPELDLEADLGIDTVKQVEVFGKISAQFNLEVPEDLKLRDLNTIALLAAYINRKVGSGEAGIETADREKVSAAKPVDDAITAIQAIIAEHTGYTVDMLEPELDLEADLGIDTVKQVEVFGKVSAHFSLAVPEDLKLSNLNTIALLVDYIQRQTGGAGHGLLLPDVAGDRPAAGDASASGVARMVVAVEKVPATAGAYNLFRDKTVLVSPDRFGYFEAVKSGIEKRGGRVVRIELPAGTSPGEARDRTRRLLASHSDIRGFIHLAPLDLFFDTTFDDRVAAGMPGAFFAALKKLYAALDIPGGFLATLSADSVVWPYQAPAGRIVPAMAGIAGMLKTAAKEMTETRVKVVDFRGSDLKAGPQSIATRFLEELTGSDTRVEAGLSDRQRFALSLKPQAPEKGESCV
ncbi:MAG: acyltransferase domain-containing protein, partial [Desulfobacterales bacterium]|nr:acyltransferase domain-containing protein [Desulfobacterales bacterium]